MQTCFFKACEHPVLPNSWKCIYHRHRARCMVENCHNQVYARRLCARHGGKKLCEVEGCNLRSRLGQVCYQHGARKKTCSDEGCEKPAHARGKCVRHGGGRKCKVEECTAHARTGGFCRRHTNNIKVEPVDKSNEMGWSQYVHGIDFPDSLSDVYGGAEREILDLLVSL